MKHATHKQNKKRRGMDRQQAIDTIEVLYPTDSQYSETNAIGKRLLQQAKDELNNWRVEPTEVLIRYAELYMAEEDRITKSLSRRE